MRTPVVRSVLILPTVPPARVLPMSLRLNASLFLLLSCCNAPLSAAEWGTLQGRITFTGKMTKPEPLDITRDEDVCGGRNLVDESLIVHPENRGLKNVVIWLASRKQVPVHPDLKDAPKPAQLDNKGCKFVPRVVRLRTNQVLRSISTDPIPHNVAVYARRNTPFSEVIPDGRALEKTFQKEELMPIRVDCSTHAWMRAWLVITEHPYSAVTDKDGRFTIKGIPQGDWTFRFWHERVGYLTDITSGGKVMSLAKGRWEISIDRDQIELPLISVSELNSED